MVTLIGALVIAGAAWFIGQAARDEIRDQARRGRAIQIMAMFAPAIESARTDPRALLVWAPLARAARQLLPDEFAMIDRATGATVPFSPDAIRRRTRSGPPTGWRGSGRTMPST